MFGADVQDNTPDPSVCNTCPVLPPYKCTLAFEPSCTLALFELKSTNPPYDTNELEKITLAPSILPVAPVVVMFPPTSKLPVKLASTAVIVALEFKLPAITLPVKSKLVPVAAPMFG